MVAVLLLGDRALTFAQDQHELPDPTIALPASYKFQFENDWVRIVRVHYDAKAQLPEHTHAGGATVYIYFNASPGVQFSHAGAMTNLRPPVKPGAIRIGGARDEHHTVTNLADTPSDFIRILLKTDYGGPNRRPNGRLAPTVMDYDHAMTHIRRIDVPPGATARVDATTNPVLRIALVPGTMEWKLADRAYRFLDRGGVEEFQNTEKTPMQLVTIELKTKIGKPE